MKIATTAKLSKGLVFSVLTTTTEITGVDHPEICESQFVIKQGESDIHAEILEEILPQFFQPRWLQYSDANDPGEPAEMSILTYIALKGLEALIPEGVRVTFVLRSEESELRRVSYYSKVLAGPMEMGVPVLDSLEVKRLIDLVEKNFEV